MKKVTVICTWKSMHEIEVPDDWQMTGYLTGFPAEAIKLGIHA